MYKTESETCFLLFILINFPISLAIKNQPSVNLRTHHPVLQSYLELVFWILNQLAASEICIASIAHRTLPQHKNDAVPCGETVGFLSDSAMPCPSEVLQLLAAPGCC